MALRHGERPPPWPPPARPACARPALSQNGYGLRLVPLENPTDCWSRTPCADDSPGPGRSALAVRRRRALVCERLSRPQHTPWNP